MFVAWFADIKGINLAGGKGANLAGMVHADLPVPPGFVITTEACHTFVEANNLQARIVELARAARTDDLTSIEHASHAIRHLFDEGTIPDPVANAVRDAYHTLSEKSSLPSDHSLSDNLFRRRQSAGRPSVAVRSSATTEDLPSASFAGQQETYLNVQGDDALLEAVKNCWSSLWTPRAMAYRARQNIDPAAVSLAVVVQEMVPADAAGVLFTANPTTGRRDEVVINAAWGLGEAIVGGQVTPDTVIADKHTGAVKQIDVAEKTVMTVPAANGTTDLPVVDSLKSARVLDDTQVAQLVRLGRDIEAHYGAPQDVEWCRSSDRFYVLQTRPITALPPVA